ncbi:MAG: hypothetical protein KDD36_02855 [Flavobacteriales bacterium]|nr:hypothetical protein [Flavobacteriales bacterium]
MKTWKAKSLIAFGLALTLLVANAWAIVIDELTREWKQSYEVNKDATVEIQNKYGKVHINTWDQNKVDIKAVAYVDVDNKEKGQKLLDDIHVTMSGSADHVKAITEINCQLTGKTCNKLKIDYTISMPKSNNLVVRNKFGDVFVNALDGNCDLNVSYGTLTCGSLSGQSNVVDLSFGKAHLDKITSCKMNSRYSDIQISEVNHLDADSKYSSLQVDKTHKLYNISEYDKLVQVGQVSEARIDCKFSNHNIGRVDEYLSLKVDYGNCTVKNIPKGFDEVDIDCKFGSAVIYFEDDASFQFSGSCSMGGLDFPREATNLTKESKGATTYQVSGVVGEDKAPTARVKVSECKYGSVKLKFNP